MGLGQDHGQSLPYVTQDTLIIDVDWLQVNAPNIGGCVDYKKDKSRSEVLTLY